MPAAYSAEIASSFTQPISNPQVTYDFGNFNDSYYWGRHLAQDYRATPGTAVVAIANGAVKYSRNVTGLGHAIHVEHTLPDGSKAVSVYYHLKRIGQGGISVSGDVTKGQTIGYVTGVAADYGSGPHLHLGIRKGAYRTGTDARTEKWFYPGYSSIFSDGVRDKNEANPLHATIASEWESDPKAFIEARPPRPTASVTIAFTGTVYAATADGSASVPGGISNGDAATGSIRYNPSTATREFFDLGDGNPFMRYYVTDGLYTFSIRGLTWESDAYQFGIYDNAPDNGEGFFIGQSFVSSGPGSRLRGQLLNSSFNFIDGYELPIQDSDINLSSLVNPLFGGGADDFRSGGSWRIRFSIDPQSIRITSD